MKKSISLVLTIALLTSCISTKKYTGFVEPEFQDIKDKTENKPENLTFDLSGLESLGSPVISTKLKSQFIPAILYWQWNNTIKCEIDAKIIGNSFKQNFIKYADSLGLQEKLQGRKLEIKVEKIPNSFVYTHKGNSVIFIVAYTVSDLEAIFPQEQDLIISYKITQNGAAIKEGRLNAKNKDQALKNVWKSPKKFTRVYIAQFKKNTSSLAKEMTQQIVSDM
jgi:hypothetical protein